MLYLSCLFGGYGSFYDTSVSSILCQPVATVTQSKLFSSAASPRKRDHHGFGLDHQDIAQLGYRIRACDAPAKRIVTLIFSTTYLNAAFTTEAAITAVEPLIPGEKIPRQMPTPNSAARDEDHQRTTSYPRRMSLSLLTT